MAAKKKVTKKTGRKKGMTEQQELFCKVYVKCLNATRAAKEAGYSEATAGSQAHDLLKKPEIREYCQKLMDERSERLRIDADRVLEELKCIALCDIAQAYREDGSLKPLQDMDEETRRAIAALDVLEEFEGKGEDREMVGYTKKIKFTDKLRALEMIGRHLRMFPISADITAQSGDGQPLEIRIGGYV